MQAERHQRTSVGPETGIEQPHLHELGQVIAVAHHRALGPGGRTAGKDDHRGIAGAYPHRPPRRAGPLAMAIEFGQRQAGGGDPGGGEQFRAPVIRDDHARFAVIGEIGELLPQQAVVERGDGGTGLEHPESGRDPSKCIRPGDRDIVSGGDALILQALRDPVAPAREVGEADSALSNEDRRGLVRRAPRPVGQPVMEQSVGQHGPSTKVVPPVLRNTSGWYSPCRRTSSAPMLRTPARLARSRRRESLPHRKP